MKHLSTDILILGSGGAGLFAALHAHAAVPDRKITIAVKGLLGKCGCTRMVQGGYNAALSSGDSIERHFTDTLEGGKWLNHQDLAWTLVENAPVRVRELENEYGCFFDRNADGTLHQKAFAGQTFDRTVHKGDLTGIEIVNRLAEQVQARGIDSLQDHRAVDLIRNTAGDMISGVLMIDIRSGEFVFVQAAAVLLATGGGPTMYRYHTPSGDKSCDGMAMALRAGLMLRDMEMVQFHPTGLLAGPGTRMTGTVLEEGLRGAGGYLLGGDGVRFMQRYDARGERATRDIVSRGIFDQIRHGNTSPNGGVFIEMAHLGPARVRSQFKGMVERCRDCGFDLAGGRVEVVPTAHYMMGGVSFEPDCTTALPGLFAAGEDTGGVHGANRLGGNGVANSTVFGGLAGDTMGRWVRAHGALREPDAQTLAEAQAHWRYPLGRAPADLEPIRDALYDVMWSHVGIIRDARGLAHAATVLKNLEDELYQVGVPAELSFNMAWHEWLNLVSLVRVSRAITECAQVRDESRGAHFRSDFPDTGALARSRFTTIRESNGAFVAESAPVQFSRLHPDQMTGEPVRTT
ncbi:MAG: L-aspartate oxidase [Acidiferrobacteraceae bacterium]